MNWIQKQHGDYWIFQPIVLNNGYETNVDVIPSFYIKFFK